MDCSPNIQNEYHVKSWHLATNLDRAEAPILDHQFCSTSIYSIVTIIRIMTFAWKASGLTYAGLERRLSIADTDGI